MVKSEIIELISNATGITKTDVKVTIDAFFKIVENCLSQQTKIDLKNVGTFYTKVSPNRMGRNPLTGEQIEIPQKYKVRFKVNSNFQKTIDNNIKESLLNK